MKTRNPEKGPYEHIFLFFVNQKASVLKHLLILHTIMQLNNLRRFRSSVVQTVSLDCFIELSRHYHLVSMMLIQKIMILIDLLLYFLGVWGPSLSPLFLGFINYFEKVFLIIILNKFDFRENLLDDLPNFLQFFIKNLKSSETIVEGAIKQGSFFCQMNTLELSQMIYRFPGLLPWDQNLTVHHFLWPETRHFLFIFTINLVTRLRINRQY